MSKAVIEYAEEMLNEMHKLADKQTLDKFIARIHADRNHVMTADGSTHEDLIAMNGKHLVEVGLMLVTTIERIGSGLYLNDLMRMHDEATRREEAIRDPDASAGDASGRSSEPPVV